MMARTAEVTGEVRGEKLTVEVEATVCDRCGFQVLTEEQSAAYTVKISDAYREQHGLLTSLQLKRIRERLGMTQKEFAKYLKVGIASVKRWEAGLIQDEAMDELIRLKTDLVHARRNVHELELRLGKGGALAGHVEVSYRWGSQQMVLPSHAGMVVVSDILRRSAPLRASNWELISA